MRLEEIIHDGHNDSDESDPNDPFLQRTEPPNQSPLSPLENMEADEVKRLVTVFDEMVNSMYPIINAEQLIQTVGWLYWEDGKEIVPGHVAPVVDVNDINILKMVLAIALLVEARRMILRP